jgi:hypothetical protein
MGFFRNAPNRDSTGARRAYPAYVNTVLTMPMNGTFRNWDRY